MRKKPDDSLISLGARLRSLRRTRGWTLRKAATESGISATYLNDLERAAGRGRRRPSLPTAPVVKRLAAAYGVPYEDLGTVLGYTGGLTDPVHAAAQRILDDIRGNPDLVCLYEAVRALGPEQCRAWVAAIRSLTQPSQPGEGQGPTGSTRRRQRGKTGPEAEPPPRQATLFAAREE